MTFKSHTYTFAICLSFTMLLTGTYGQSVNAKPQVSLKLTGPVAFTGEPLAVEITEEQGYIDGISSGNQRIDFDHNDRIYKPMGFYDVLGAAFAQVSSLGGPLELGVSVLARGEDTNKKPGIFDPWSNADGVATASWTDTIVVGYEGSGLKSPSSEPKILTLRFALDGVLSLPPAGGIALGNKAIISVDTIRKGNRFGRFVFIEDSLDCSPSSRFYSAWNDSFIFRGSGETGNVCSINGTVSINVTLSETVTPGILEGGWHISLRGEVSTIIGSSKTDFSNTLTFESVLMEDGSTPESQGIPVSFSSGIESPNAYYDNESDGDGFGDEIDNCIDISNVAQRDTDFDGYGNFCDPDFDNNLVVNASDLAYLKTKFFSSDSDADLNGDGIVNAADLAMLKTMFFKPPGPSCCAP